ncbi:uncharacterized protein LOC106644237 [Copidosoma floridanum]|uniref:uncharacterized protein LOC106644237 n=1 Tax=Copidosoma floridanum TaxID=29053 RepID=UPI0006C97A33|nr:uncharacterized protein LOC106644237 [Copidosoma floridanum]
MDSFSWSPNRRKINCDSIMMLSPITKTPIRQSGIRLKTSYQNHTNNLSLLPHHITPPSGLTKFIARNPFEAELTSKLHVSVMSPTVFSKVPNSSHKKSPGFTWNIDELALIHPAKIDEFPMQQTYCSDPESEIHAQEAISRFFSENQIVPSPYDDKNNDYNKRDDMETPVKSQEQLNLSKEILRQKKEKKDNSAQTILTLPPILPPHVEEILKPYFNFTQDQNCETEEANNSNTSLRRKLFFNNDDSQDDSSNSISTPPKRSKSPLNHDLSPPQSGMFFHGTPIKSASQIVQRTYGSPLACSHTSSPCDVSPISNPVGFNMSCQSIKSRKSVAKLDFTNDMSIDIEDYKNKDDKILCETLFSSEEIKMSGTVSHHHSDNDTYNDITQMAISYENSVVFRYENKENIAPNMLNGTSKSKCIEDSKMPFNENYALQQSKMLSGNYVKQMASSSHHDTGYQTYSSSSNLTSNITNTDSYSSLTKQKQRWNERTTHTDEDVQLTDWENAMNMISSTPSKYNRGIHNF